MTTVRSDNERQFTFGSGGAAQHVALLALDELTFRGGNLRRAIVEKVRQLAAVARSRDLARALASEWRPPAEGSHWRCGETIRSYTADGRCRRLRLCGLRSGGFSNVYTVIDLDEMRPFCLKEFRDVSFSDQEGNTRIAAEAAISLRLGVHENLVTTHAVLAINGRVLILTEYLPEASLDIKLKAGSAPLESTLRYATDICRALAHARSIFPSFVHGDIKPANCLMTADGRLKVGDFGQASVYDNDVSASAGATERNGSESNFGGTSAYMAPELFGTCPRSSLEADVYAFGITLFEMLAGSRPFYAASYIDWADAQRHAQPPLDTLMQRKVPSSLIKLVENCLAKAPADRPPSFASIQDQLQVAASAAGFNLSQNGRAANSLTEADAAARDLSLAELGYADIAVKRLDNLKENSDLPHELLAYQALALLTAGRIDEAYFASTSALMAGAESFLVLLTHARVMLARGRSDTAHRYLFRALKIKPKNCVALNLMGDLSLTAGEMNETAALTKKSLAIDPAQPSALETMAKVELVNGNARRSERLAIRSLRINPRRAPAHELLVHIYNGERRFAKAVDAAKAALRLSPGSKLARRRFVRTCADLFEASGHAADLRIIKLLLRAARLCHAGPARYRFIDDFFAVFVRQCHRPLLIFCLDDALCAAMADIDAKGAAELASELRGLEIRWEESGREALYSAVRIFFHLGLYEDCQRIATAIMRKDKTDERPIFYLAACAEVRDELRISLRLYKKALRLSDCEDNRLGVRRVLRKIKLSRRAQKERKADEAR